MGVAACATAKEILPSSRVTLRLFLIQATSCGDRFVGRANPRLSQS